MIPDHQYQKLLSDYEVLKKRLDRLVGDVQAFYDVLDPPVAWDEQSIVTAVQINASELKFQKKTRTLVGKFTDQESIWTDWHTGVTCDNTGGTFETAIGENLASFTPTLALLRITGAI